MIIYKDKQFLVFDFEDGKTCKYDFATKQTIGKRGKPVQSLHSQLKDVTYNDFLRSFKDKNYADFIQFVHNSCWHSSRKISTLIEELPRFAVYEQYFAAGLGHLVTTGIKYPLSDIPKGLLKVCRKHNIKLTTTLVDSYKENPDAYNLASSGEFITLEPKDVVEMCRQTIYNYDERRWLCAYNELISNFNYNPKTLLNYIDYLMTFEALEDTYFILRELYDYASMMSKISRKFDKYPKHFLTTHKIACRNYNRLKEQIDKQAFAERVDLSMETTIDDYVFIYPKDAQEIKDEAVSQSNCVASYIKSVVAGTCHIMFMRHKDAPEQSLVTLEIRDNKIVQARQRYNYATTEEQNDAIEKWEQWRAKQVKKEEGDGHACKVA